VGVAAYPGDDLYGALLELYFLTKKISRAKAQRKQRPKALPRF
jgi:hypothetical protein